MNHLRTTYEPPINIGEKEKENQRYDKGNALIMNTQQITEALEKSNLFQDYLLNNALLYFHGNRH